MILCRSLKCGHTFDAAVAVKARRKSLTSQWVRRRRRAKWNGVRVSCGHYDVSMFCSQDMEYRLFGRSSVPKGRKEHLVPAKCSRGCWTCSNPSLRQDEIGRVCRFSCCARFCQQWPKFCWKTVITPRVFRQRASETNQPASGGTTATRRDDHQCGQCLKQLSTLQGRSISGLLHVHWSIGACVVC